MSSTFQPAGDVRSELRGGWPASVTDDLAYLRTMIVNVVFYGKAGAGDRSWVLIDAGMPGSVDAIREAAEQRFGRGARPSAIVMTHGHFDHVGALEALAETWDVPVFAHELELPYLTGRSPYPPPDPTVGGGLMASLSWMYPRGPIDLGNRVRRLPDDGTVPGMSGWRWVLTPGHTAGHVSFFRDEDRALIAGDAFITTRQESAIAVFTQRAEIHGPPAYYTTDWGAAEDSVRRLADLDPQVTITGHGPPLGGDSLRDGLRRLASEFGRLAIPEHGRYVDSPAITDERGVVAVPPDVVHPLARPLLGLGAGIVAGLAIQALMRPAPRRGR